MSQSPTTQAEQWTVISTYTRAQAIADGVLIAATAATATEAGWKHPVAYTAAAHAQAVAWDEATEAGKKHYTGQDQSGREWHVLSMAARAARAPGTGSRRGFLVYAVPSAGPDVAAQEIALIVAIGPGDHGEAVVTIMLTTED